MYRPNAQLGQPATTERTESNKKATRNTGGGAHHRTTPRTRAKSFLLATNPLLYYLPYYLLWGLEI
jgi:hypothetical protein